ncbi:MAG TPA: tRNA (adenine-N1)-methyltransferase [Anaerolineales bacterium]|nr:tRNA (adenine-N1)-methyltransferase [Anaerolineales bacterium]
MNLIQAGDLVQLVGRDHKYMLVRLTPQATLQTHRGVLRHDDLIGQPWGAKVMSHIGRPFYLLPPATSDILRDIRRNSQIIFPKDIGYILLKLSIVPGQTVVEAGTGSGGLTTALAMAVGEQGRVISYDIREDMQNLARRNLAQLGLAERVEFVQHDIGQGFPARDVPALFLDLLNPHDYIGQVREALRPGGFFGAIVPTTNQITTLLSALERHTFAFVEVCELWLRYFKPVPERLRPTDRMVAHTGYLIFARPVIEPFDSEPAADSAPDDAEGAGGDVSLSEA